METINELFIFRTFLGGVAVAFISILVLIAKYRRFLRGIFTFFQAIDVNLVNGKTNTEKYKESLKDMAEDGKLVSPHHFCMIRHTICDSEFEKVKDNVSNNKERLRTSDENFAKLIASVAMLEAVLKQLQETGTKNHYSLSMLHSKWAAIAQGTQILYNIAKKEHPEFAELFPDLTKVGRSSERNNRP